MTNLALTFAPQLDFPWAQDGSLPAPRADDFLEVPLAQAYKSAAAPILITEKPVPLKYSNASQPQKKLVQFTGVPKSKKARKVVVRHKFSNFSNLPNERFKNLPKKSKASRPKEEEKAESKPTWNDDTKTIGVFDTRVTKQQPLSVKLAIKSQGPSKSKSVTTFENWDDMPMKPTKQKNARATSASRGGRVEEFQVDNLDFKFVSDQTAVISQLEKDLRSEKEARLAIGKQMQQRMQQIESYRQTNAELMHAKKEFQQRTVARKQSSPRKMQVDDRATVKPAPKPKPTQNIAIARPEDFVRKDQEEWRRKLAEDDVIHDRKGGNIYEPPTKDEEPILIEVEEDLTPMVLRAQTKPKPSQRQEAAVPKPRTQHVYPTPIPAKPQPTVYPTPPGIRPPEYGSRSPKYQISPKHSAHNSVNFAEKPLHPMMQTISNALAKADRAERYGVQSTIGLVSRVSARYIAFYADNIADLLVDDLFEDTIRELNRIESYEESRLKREFADEADAYIHSLVHEFQTTADQVMHKYKQPVSHYVPDVDQEIEEAKAIYIEDAKKDWEIQLDTEVLRSIHEHRRETYQYAQTRECDGLPLWEAYTTLGEAFLQDVLEEVLNEFSSAADEFTDRVIGQEFM